jgi:hypothetical protein
MPWWSSAWYAYDKGTVNARAPSASGVYGLKDADGEWIYVGECAAIAGRLLRHLAARKAWAPEASPTLFSFEMCSEKERVARRDALVQELHPTCSLLPMSPK